MNDTRNIFSSIPTDIPQELFENILTTDSFRIERIVSQGQASPEGFWYDQEQNEWIILLKGRAGLLFEGSDHIVDLKAGDYLNIPAHLKHRVQWTDPSCKTIWLAIMY